MCAENFSWKQNVFPCAVQDIFTGKFSNYSIKKKVIEIPVFQRPFCWSAIDIQKILDDIDTLRFDPKSKSYDEANQYFFGSICFQEENDQLNLLDGQQRLTSFLILAAVLLQEAKDSTNTDIKILAKKISIQLGGDGSEKKPWEEIFHYDQPQTIRHIQLIYRTLRSQYKSLKIQSISAVSNSQRQINLFDIVLLQDLKRFAYILSEGCFSVTLLHTQRAAEQFFQGENNRGMPMTLIDILKAYHMRFVPIEKIEYVKKIWEKFTITETKTDNTTKQEQPRKILENYVLPVLLMPYGVCFWECLDVVHVDKLKGFLGTNNLDLLVDEKIKRSSSLDSKTEKSAQKKNIYDILDPIHPGVGFFEKIDQYFRLAKVVKQVLNTNLLLDDWKIFDYPDYPFWGAPQLLTMGMISWCDRFLPKDILNKTDEDIEQSLLNNAEFLVYSKLIWSFFRRLRRDKENKRKEEMGVYSKLSVYRVLDLLDWYNPLHSLFLLPHHTSSPAACRRAFAYAISPEVMGKKLSYKSEYKENYEEYCRMEISAC